MDMKRWKKHKLYVMWDKAMMHIREDHISAYAAQMAYFVILAFIPFVMFLTTIIKYTPLTYEVMSETIAGFIPINLQKMVLNIVDEVYKRSYAVLPVSALVALWTAGKSIQSMIHGLNTIYNVKETRNWIIGRIYSVGYMLLFITAIMISLFLLVLGNMLRKLLLEDIPVIGSVLTTVFETRILLVFSVLFLIFLMLYKFLPNRKTYIKIQVPGAVFTAAGWMFFSFGFSLYFKLSHGFAKMYGSLTALVMVMLWLYACMYLALLGAEINLYFEKKWNNCE